MVLALVWAVPLPAQMCAGFAALEDTRFRATVSASSHSYANVVGASLTAGRTVFGTLGAARAYDEDPDVAAYDVSLEVGADVADGRRRAFLCPIAALSASIQPRDYLVFVGTGYQKFSGALGLGLAGVALRSRQVALHPAAGARVVHLRARESYPGGHHDASDTFVLLTGGVGLVIRDVLTIRPGVSVPFGFTPADHSDFFAVPFGREERELSFDVSVGINFGHRAPRASRKP